MAKVARVEEYNVLVLGSDKVGKTSLLNKYLHDEFTEDTRDSATNECASIVINKKEIAMQFWEVTGVGTQRAIMHTLKSCVSFLSACDSECIKHCRLNHAYALINLTSPVLVYIGTYSCVWSTMHLLCVRMRLSPTCTNTARSV